MLKSHFSSTIHEKVHSTPNPNARKSKAKGRVRSSRKRQINPSPKSSLRPSRVRPLLIRALLTLIALDALLTLSTRHTADRRSLSISFRFLLPLLLIDLNKPLVLVVLVLALVSPAREPLAGRLVVLQLLAALLVVAGSTGLLAELANALLAREQLPFRGRLRGRQGLVPREVDVGGGEGQENTVGHGGFDFAGCQELVEKNLHAIAGCRFQ